MDITLMLGRQPSLQFHNRHDEEDWTVTLADTGEETMTAGRVKRIQRYVPQGADFLLTYGDGVANIDINASIAAHKAAGKACTISAVHPAGRFGSVRIAEGGSIHTFSEKPQLEESYINGGYFVCAHRFFDYLPDDPNVMLERQPMDRLVRDSQLHAFKHEGFLAANGYLPGGAIPEQDLGRRHRPMESLVTVAFADSYRGKRVLVTGHTGFKGSWLCAWLLNLGAQVHGFALDPEPQATLFDQLGLAGRLSSDTRADLADRERLGAVVARIRPDFVFHLAAQPLVRLSYERPVETYQTNVLGTIHLLEALRSLREPCAAVLVTTDKCYENREWMYGYREEDSLGGHDPYSSSKAAREIAIQSWRRSFFTEHPVRIASARAGNVIGGGDWALDRLVPDCIRALQAGRAIPVRNKDATRPWQHVLEPLSGYLWLAAVLAKPGLRPLPAERFATAFNFGPGHDANRTVGELVEEVLKSWPGRWEDRPEPAEAHEAGLLQLSTDKASALLGWSPVWTFPEARCRKQSPGIARTRPQTKADS